MAEWTAVDCTTGAMWHGLALWNRGVHLYKNQAPFGPKSGKGANALKLRDKASPTPATLILNASPDPTLLNIRAKVLNDAGYYTSSARTPEEAAQYAVSMNCDLALICYSFGNTEQKALFDSLQTLSPGITIVCVDPELDRNQGVLVSRIERALAGLTAQVG